MLDFPATACGHSPQTHGDAIDTESTPGAGTTFTVALSLASGL